MKKRVIAAGLFFVSFHFFAQKSNVSAYSFLGTGDYNDQSTVEQFSMGGLTTAVGEEYNINMVNPATNAFLRFTSYNLSLKGLSLKMASSDKSASVSDISLNYAAMGVPLGKKGGLIFGLTPYTTSGYSLFTDTVDEEDESTILYRTFLFGSGGLNKAFVGLGYTLTKNLSIGIQPSLLFGRFENNTINLLAGDPLASKYEAIVNMRGIAFTGGVHYKKQLEEGKEMQLGAAVDFEDELQYNGKRNLYSVDGQYFTAPRDTILNTSSSGKFKIPLSYSLGAGIGKKNKWYLGVDYKKRGKQILNSDILGFESNTKYEDAYKFSMGGYYIPRSTSVTNYWDRVIYRAGFHYGQSGNMIDPLNSGNYTSLNKTGIAFGVGLPIGKQLSKLNLGIEFGKRGTTQSGLIEERYVNIKISLSLVDKWFRKFEYF